MSFLLIAVGLVGLLFGGEMLVRGAVSLAKRLGISPLVIGLTLVGFGTSTPELVTSIQAALAGSPGVAVGNVVGSNIANVLLILGMAALIAPVAADPRAFRRDGGALIAATILGVLTILLGTIEWELGLVLICGLVLYLAAVLMIERRDVEAGRLVEESETLTEAPGGAAVAFLFFLGGLVVTVLGARFLVTGAVDIARSFGVSEAVIGLTLVAVGTSLPELVTSVIAARKGQADVALGNVVGSNIYNILGILGVTALVRPLEVPPEIARFDVWVMAASTVALVVAVVSGWRVTRTEGAMLLAAYAAYIAWLVLQL
ncbi:calcium/sodium antiporter [Parvularcula dongshanensis]|uniref:Cation:H+ antiporter n=1 Tax=Parvularcula dongshanensis TaxID=1173995 RepID=A0A840I227_9PROT|nr:calcium/sodium antiporter [Parvularcula dongshanensis]MBB4659066.1 cation:H+ antiporter [Parvularcula dongshanensis]